jgi:hypothetical protein
MANSEKLKLEDDLMSGKLGIRFSRVVARGYDAGHSPASDNGSRGPNRGYGRAPKTGFAFVSNN